MFGSPSGEGGTKQMVEIHIYDWNEICVKII